MALGLTTGHQGQFTLGLTVPMLPSHTALDTKLPTSTTPHLDTLSLYPDNVVHLTSHPRRMGL